IPVVLNSVPAVGAIQFSATNLPARLQIDRSTGIISGQIRSDAAGIYSTTVTVTENGTRSLSQTFQWTVRSHRSGGGGSSSRLATVASAIAKLMTSLNAL